METSSTIAMLLAASGIALAYTPTEIAAESKKANDFFEKCWDETLSHYSVDESYYGIKAHYDQLKDLSDEKATDEKVWERQLADLRKTLMINIHKIDDVKDAEAYIARLRGFPKLSISCSLI